MYAMTGTLTAQIGKRELLVNILVRASALVMTMPGCKAYIVLEDLKDEQTVAVFEMWDDKEAHDVSLQDPRVRSLISEAMPILAGAPSGGEYRVATNL
ncbi:MAG TPA: antibiotic biosynthesis monooxygenase [Anaerolineales bacterium]|nr:antibiotic biosynthesis monooxygenase [Anaerolineales bacterium]